MTERSIAGYFEDPLHYYTLEQIFKTAYTAGRKETLNEVKTYCNGRIDFYKHCPESDVRFSDGQEFNYRSYAYLDVINKFCN